MRAELKCHARVGSRTKTIPHRQTRRLKTHPHRFRRSRTVGAYFGLRPKKRQSGTPLNLADLTIIGAYLFPSRVVRARGYASALLVDVRNGYPYGTAAAVVKDGTLAPTVFSDESAKLMDEHFDTAYRLMTSPQARDATAQTGDWTA